MVEIGYFKSIPPSSTTGHVLFGNLMLSENRKKVASNILSVKLGIQIILAVKRKCLQIHENVGKSNFCRRNIEWLQLKTFFLLQKIANAFFK